jgi:hypothetical protein
VTTLYWCALSAVVRARAVCVYVCVCGGVALRGLLIIRFLNRGLVGIVRVQPVSEEIQRIGRLGL